MSSPEIRFKGFEEKYEQCKVGDICSIGTGKSNTQDQVNNGKYPFFIRSDTPVKSDKYLYDCEAVITIGDGEIGKVFHYIDGKFDLHQRCYKMTDFKDILGKYFFHIFSAKFHEQTERMSAKMTVDSVRLDMISEMNIQRPKTIVEQKQVSNMLTDIDSLIASYKTKYKMLRTIKKALLDNMLPKDGEDVPKVRFDGFTGAWEQHKLSDLCTSFEYGLNVAAKEFDGKNKYIRITDIDDITREFLLTDLSSPDIYLEGLSKYLLSNGDIVFARTGASVGKTYIYKEKDGVVYFAGFLIRAKVNQNNDAEFVFQNTLLSNYEKYIRITSQRTGQPGVNAKEYGEFPLLVPKKEEQQKIGKFLGGLDHLITIYQQKLNMLQNIKNAMLQKMFA